MPTASRNITRRLPGVEGVWVFIGADLVMFAVLFVSFMLDRRQKLALFESSRHALNISIGGINTLILLCSSWFVALAVDAVKHNRQRRAARCLAAGFCCGLLFFIVKMFVYGSKLSAGITPATNDFFMYYFMLTGLHLAHVMAGTVVLGIMWKKSRSGEYSAANHAGLEMGASYWHMVDLLWIFLFALLYLTR